VQFEEGNWCSTQATPLPKENFGKKKVLEVGTKVLWPLSNYKTKYNWRASL